MVTLVFVTVLVITILYNALIDRYLHKIGLVESLSHLYGLDLGAGQWFLICQMMIGLAVSLLSDWRRRKKMKQQNSQQSQEAEES
ncbi:MAG: hypothetical protein WCC10_17485 [Tumebacillaceae bacterium]